MAKVDDPREPFDPGISIPGLKPPVLEFEPCVDSDASAADAFKRMVRELRDGNVPPLNREMEVFDTNAVSTRFKSARVDPSSARP